MNHKIKYKNRTYSSVVKVKRIEHSIINMREYETYSSLVSIFLCNLKGYFCDIFTKILSNLTDQECILLRLIDYRTCFLLTSFWNNKVKSCILYVPNIIPLQTLILKSQWNLQDTLTLDMLLTTQNCIVGGSLGMPNLSREIQIRGYHLLELETTGGSGPVGRLYSDEYKKIQLNGKEMNKHNQKLARNVNKKYVTKSRKVYRNGVANYKL